MGDAGNILADETRRPLTIGASAQQRVLEAIRRHFRDFGGPPSWAELSLATGVQRESMGRVLRRLAERALITVQPGPRGIRLVDRSASLSDRELELAVHARGGQLHWPTSAVLAVAYPIEAAADCTLPFADLLRQIDRAEAGERSGETEAQQQAGKRGQAPPT